MSGNFKRNPRFEFAGQYLLNTPQPPSQVDAGWSGGGAIDPSQLTPEQLQALIPNMQTNAYVSDQMNPDRVGPGYWDEQIGGAADAMAAQNNPMDPLAQEQMAAKALMGADKEPSMREALIRALLGR